MELTGFITRRRCIGRNLAFADVQLEDNRDNINVPLKTKQEEPTSTLEGDINPALEDVPGHTETTVVQVIFHRNAPAWDSDWPENVFPNKNAKLPYGGKIWVQVLQDPEALPEGSVKPESKADILTYRVQRWRLLENPHEMALKVATNNPESETGGGILCTKYLKARGEAFSKFNDSAFYSKPKPKTPKNPEEPKQSKTDDEAAFSHGDKRTKSLRAYIFAKWLLERYGSERLKDGAGVLDVAGGKGKLSMELALQGHVPCTIVDPLVRKHGSKLDPRVVKRLRKAGAPHPKLLPTWFNATSFLQDSEELLRDASICVGLHPDECTEDILDLSLQYNKRVAIVPLRHLADGRPVRTYEEFLKYLLAKDERLQKAELPFEGRNVVIYLPEKG